MIGAGVGGTVEEKTSSSNDDSSGVRYPTKVKSVGFRIQLEVSRGCNHTKEL